MMRTTQKGLSLSCLIGSVLGGIVGFASDLHLPYFMFLWILAAIGITTYPDNGRTRRRRRRRRKTLLMGT